MTSRQTTKKVGFEQILLMIIAGVYLLESYFISGMFTNLPLLIVTLAIGLFAIIKSSIQKQSKWVILDLIVCLICAVVAAFLYY